MFLVKPKAWRGLPTRPEHSELAWRDWAKVGETGQSLARLGALRQRISGHAPGGLANGRHTPIILQCTLCYDTQIVPDRAYRVTLSSRCFRGLQFWLSHIKDHD